MSDLNKETNKKTNKETNMATITQVIEDSLPKHFISK